MIDPDKYSDESDFTLDPNDLKRVRDTPLEWYKADSSGDLS